MPLFYPNIQWTLSQKIVFRFFFLFVLLYIFPFPLDYFLFFIPIAEVFSSFVNSLVPFFGNTLLDIEGEISSEFNGSGDMTYHYVSLFIFVSLSIAGTSAWSFFDRKRTSYDKLFHYFLICCRYYLGFTLVNYGWQKVFHLQMPHIGLGQLLQPIGDQTPMGLAWKFVGFSELYSKYVGWAEVMSGALLFSRRLTLLGAISAFVVMLNVMVMNYAYDIPVKIYSGFLVILSLVILSPSFTRLAGFFLLEKRVEPIEYRPLFYKKYARVTRYVLKPITLLLAIVFTGYEAYAATSEYGDGSPRPPLYGIYKTQSFIRNSDTIPLYSDSTVWKTMVFNRQGMISVNKFSDKRYPCNLDVDTEKKTLVIKFLNGTADAYHLNYTQLNDTMFKFTGSNKREKIEMICKRLYRTDFMLYKTGFNWINEQPNNR